MSKRNKREKRVTLRLSTEEREQALQEKRQNLKKAKQAKRMQIESEESQELKVNLKSELKEISKQERWTDAKIKLVQRYSD